MAKRRCPWGDSDDPEYRDYHDTEWGVPVHDDRRLFESLVLQGAQAGGAEVEKVELRKLKISPFSTWKLTPCTAWISPKDLYKPSTSIAFILIFLLLID